MVALHAPALLDVGPQRGLFGGAHPAAAIVTLALFITGDLRLGQPAKPLVPNLAGANLLHGEGSLPAVARFDITQELPGLRVVWVFAHRLD